ncbi:hypothetical protein G6F68_014952 [Rhizopus microsporus]|nr:hypothetical protein G6F68_014952 [Rhizopus microsporus]
MGRAAIGGYTQAAAGIGQVALSARLPASCFARGEGWRCRALKQVGRHPPLAECGRQAFGPLAGRPADVFLADAGRHRCGGRVTALARQAVRHVEHQWQCGDRAVLPGKRRAIRTPHPHAHGVVAGTADRPRIAVAITGAGLPGHARAAADVEGADALAPGEARRRSIIGSSSV